MEKVPERGYDARRLRRVVVSAEKRSEPRVGLERGTDPLQCVPVGYDVGVHEDENVAGRAPGSLVARGGRCGRRIIDHHDLVGAIQGGEAAREGWRRVGRRHDDGEPGQTGVSCPAVSDWCSLCRPSSSPTSGSQPRIWRARVISG